MIVVDDSQQLPPTNFFKIAMKMINAIPPFEESVIDVLKKKIGILKVKLEFLALK